MIHFGSAPAGKFYAPLFGGIRRFDYYRASPEAFFSAT